MSWSGGARTLDPALLRTLGPTSMLGPPPAGGAGAAPPGPCRESEGPQDGSLSAFLERYGQEAQGCCPAQAKSKVGEEAGAHIYGSTSSHPPHRHRETSVPISIILSPWEK